MVLENCKIQDNCLVIPREELLRWAELYHAAAGEYLQKDPPNLDPMFDFYIGKVEVLLDMLKLFEQLNVQS